MQTKGVLFKCQAQKRISPANLVVAFSLEILISTLNFVFRKLHYQINIHRASNGSAMSLLLHILKYVEKQL